MKTWICSLNAFLLRLVPSDEEFFYSGGRK